MKSSVKCAACGETTEFEFRAAPCGHSACALCMSKASKHNKCARCEKPVTEFTATKNDTWLERRSRIHEYAIQVLGEYPARRRTESAPQLGLPGPRGETGDTDLDRLRDRSGICVEGATNVPGDVAIHNQ